MNLPETFLKRMEQQLGKEYPAFIDSLQEPAPVSVRANNYKRVTTFDSCVQVLWEPSGFYLPERILFTADPLFHAGCYYVQEASSMFLGYVLRQLVDLNVPLKILDLCAAPGGKSTQLLSLLNDKSLLVSNELVPARNNVLRYNLQKWGRSNVILTQNNANTLRELQNYFDVIVVDAPCSGEGLFRKDPAAIDEWNENAVAVCATRQSQILEEILPALKPGGFLIYSTCTFEESENDRQLKQLVDHHEMESVAISKGSLTLSRTQFGLQFYPHRIKGEGFFIGVLKKPFSPHAAVQPNRKANLPELSGKYRQYLSSECGEWLQLEKDQEVYAIPDDHGDAFGLLSQHAYVRKGGIHLGTLKGKDFIPSHELALSNDIATEHLLIDLDEPAALRYLKGEQIQVNGADDGWHLVAYGGFPLGWIKKSGNRINNYYPKPHRIRMVL